MWVEFYWKFLNGITSDSVKYKHFCLSGFSVRSQLESKSVSHIVYACTNLHVLCKTHFNMCVLSVFRLRSSNVSFVCFRLRAFGVLLRAFGFPFAVINLRICAFVFKIIRFRAWKFSFSFRGITENDVNLAVASTVRMEPSSGCFYAILFFFR